MFISEIVITYVPIFILATYMYTIMYLILTFIVHSVFRNDKPIKKKKPELKSTILYNLLVD